MVRVSVPVPDPRRCQEGTRQPPGTSPCPACLRFIPHPNFSRAAGGRSGRRGVAISVQGVFSARRAGRPRAFTLSGGALHTRARESRKTLSGGGKVPPGAGLFFSPHMNVFPHSLCSAMPTSPQSLRHAPPAPTRAVTGKGPEPVLASPGERPPSPGGAPRGSRLGCGSAPGPVEAPGSGSAAPSRAGPRAQRRRQGALWSQGRDGARGARARPGPAVTDSGARSAPRGEKILKKGEKC